MSIYTEDEFDSEELESNAPVDGEDFRLLRRAANKSKKTEQENQALRRELAFAKAGLPLDDPRMNYFIKGYEGELQAEAIRQAAMDSGFIQAQQQQQQQADDGQSRAVMAAQNRVMQASAGAMTSESGEEAAISQLSMAMNEGGIEAMLDVARQYGLPTSYDS
jgi:hypothetical protein